MAEMDACSTAEVSLHADSVKCELLVFLASKLSIYSSSMNEYHMTLFFFSFLFFRILNPSKG